MFFCFRIAWLPQAVQRRMQHGPHFPTEVQKGRKGGREATRMFRTGKEMVRKTYAVKRYDFSNSEESRRWEEREGA